MTNLKKINDFLYNCDFPKACCFVSKMFSQIKLNIQRGNVVSINQHPEIG